MQLGYLGIIALMVFSPFPPELFIPLAGFWVAQGHLNPIGVVAAALCGFLLSILPWYCAGRFLGEKRLQKLLQRHRWLAVPSQDIHKGKHWFRRHGGKAVLICLFVPGSRNLIALPAGLSGMSPVTFLAYTTVGGILWLSGLLTLGYFLGDRYQLVQQHYDSLSSLIFIAVVVVLAICAIGYYWQRRGSFTRR
ncbi:DedA family protein [Leptolyngbya sp. 7M]|uniref:DedA family protein n=1 Tax=Leptolyngbya sp. 7M TaxID=2812896 RepID=UPI001B8AB04C|nr:DedA family protein [Leptolyngbya sp. 7M]QYO63508.1 DedA family protein [Leptolyngbya sp. 7M]